MIFVTIGTMYGFPRLIMEMDKIAENTKEEIIMQIGQTEYEPKNTKYFRFASRVEMNQIFMKSRVVISHGGIGTILSALEYMKPIIVIPRRKEYGEIIDDHQFETTRELENEGIIKAAYNINELRNILMEPINFSFNPKKENVLAIKLKNYLNQLNINFAKFK